MTAPCDWSMLIVSTVFKSNSSGIASVLTTPSTSFLHRFSSFSPSPSCKEPRRCEFTGGNDTKHSRFASVGVSARVSSTSDSGTNSTHTACPKSTAISGRGRSACTPSSPSSSTPSSTHTTSNGVLTYHIRIIGSSPAEAASSKSSSTSGTLK
ncbi:hypothetical protein A0H81_10132 [Grifola frondosa]|uniref:Uncharacterized protein n=1 Tax=Grifola frondosa TaxID=5627 RepID=A0A1C7LZT6_GRIFR|nr:hypothetical protein A0H81_10132 [Grifola frondosa]